MALSLAVDRPEADICFFHKRHHKLAGRDENLFTGEGDILTGLNRFDSWIKADHSGNAHNHKISFGHGRRVDQTLDTRVIKEPGLLNHKPLGLVVQEIGVGLGRQTNNPKPIGEMRRRASSVWVPMLPRRTEHHDSFRFGHGSVYLRRSAILIRVSVAAHTDSRFRLTETQAKELASTYGTPLYVVDEAHFRAKIKRYRADRRRQCQNSEITFASKANSTLALIAIADSEGCGIDVASEGELRAAIAAGVKPSNCHLHGNNKQPAEIRFALEVNVGQIVVDHFTEIETLATMLEGERTKVVLRLAPGVDPVTHAKISTGQADTKFGFNIADGSAEAATVRCVELGLPLIGFHCHVGSQLLDPEAQRAGGELIARFASKMAERHGFTAEYINVGGGLGVKYLDEHNPMPVEDYCRLIAEAVLPPLRAVELDPVLAQEPGRSLIAESGVTLYKVGAIKTVPTKGEAHRTYVAVDGGLSDNPRPAFYGSKYTVERVARASAAPDWIPPRKQETVKSSDGSAVLATISGKHCETDRLFEDITLPLDVAEGDLLQVLVTGAYNSSMASNYNRYPRPATALLLQNGGHVLIQRQDSWDEMFARETVPEGLRR